eukprot:Nk52_evm46s151 gene=Nk52_evmTU46s151
MLLWGRLTKSLPLKGGKFIGRNALIRRSEPPYGIGSKCGGGLYQRISSSAAEMGNKENGKGDGRSLQLKVSEPAFLLNDIAQRYSSAPRVVMEYVDNAIDDGESEYRKNGNRYLTPMYVQVLIDKESRKIVVRDNRMGMSKTQLINVVQNVGNSGKKGVAWLNGQFGFGMHAFRAMAENMTVRSTKKDDNVGWEISINRDISFDIKSPSMFECSTSIHGTEVTISNLDESWVKHLSKEQIQKEIEHHFESLLSRQDFFVSVHETSLSSYSLTNFCEPIRYEDFKAGELCSPFDYSLVDGAEFFEDIEIGKSHLNVRLKIAPKEYRGHTARFFGVGRRINSVSGMKSFMDLSVYKDSLWAHPNLVGFIEVNDCVKPVITRDEFARNSQRDLLYKELLKLEKRLKVKLDEEMEKHRTLMYQSVENFLGKILDNVAIQDGLEEVVEKYDKKAKQRGAPRAKKEKATIKGDTQDSKEDGRRAKKITRSANTFFKIKFSELPANDENETRRSMMLNNIIEINTLHPDFKERLTVDKKGHLDISERFVSYISNIVSSHYRDHLSGYNSMDAQTQEIYENLLNSYSAIEGEISQRIERLKRALRKDAKGPSN